MTHAERFELVTHGPWVTGGNNIQYRLEGKTLCFQGSNEDSDWKYNFDFAVWPYKNMRELFLVHRGFLKAWKSVRDEIALLDFDSIVGYSMGGALAILAHEDFRYRKGYQPETTVFGCPKVLFLPSRRIRSRFSQVTRIFNKEDIVAKVPPLYSHVGVAVKLTEKVTNSGMTFWERASGHAPAMYRARLK